MPALPRDRRGLRWAALRGEIAGRARREARRPSSGCGGPWRRRSCCTRSSPPTATTSRTRSRTSASSSSPSRSLFCQLAAVRWDAAHAAGGRDHDRRGRAGRGARRHLAVRGPRPVPQQGPPRLEPAEAGYFRVNSVFFDPNVFGRYLALGAITVSAAVAWSRGGRSAWLATGAGLVMLAGLALTLLDHQRRGLLAGLGILALLRYGMRGAIAAAVGGPGDRRGRSPLSGGADRSDIGPTRGIDEETSGRVNLLEGGIELIEDRAARGLGVGRVRPGVLRPGPRDRDDGVALRADPRSPPSRGSRAPWSTWRLLAAIALGPVRRLRRGRRPPGRPPRAAGRRADGPQPRLRGLPHRPGHLGGAGAGGRRQARRLRAAAGAGSPAEG